MNSEEEFVADAIDVNAVAQERQQDATEDDMDDENTNTPNETEDQIDAEPLSEDAEIPFLYKDYPGTGVTPQY